MTVVLDQSHISVTGYLYHLHLTIAIKYIFMYSVSNVIKGLRHPETLENIRICFTDSMRLNTISLLLMCRACISAYNVLAKYP